MLALNRLPPPESDPSGGDDDSVSGASESGLAPDGAEQATETAAPVVDPFGGLLGSTVQFRKPSSASAFAPSVLPARRRNYTPVRRGVLRTDTRSKNFGQRRQYMLQAVTLLRKLASGSGQPSLDQARARRALRLTNKELSARTLAYNALRKARRRDRDRVYQRYSLEPEYRSARSLRKRIRELKDRVKKLLEYLRIKPERKLLRQITRYRDALKQLRKLEGKYSRAKKRLKYAHRALRHAARIMARTAGDPETESRRSKNARRGFERANVWLMSAMTAEASLSQRIDKLRRRADGAERRARRYMRQVPHVRRRHYVRKLAKTPGRRLFRSARYNLYRMKRQRRTSRKFLRGRNLRGVRSDATDVVNRVDAEQTLDTDNKLVGSLLAEADRAKLPAWFKYLSAYYIGLQYGSAHGTHGRGKKPVRPSWWYRRKYLRRKLRYQMRRHKRRGNMERYIALKRRYDALKKAIKAYSKARSWYRKRYSTEGWRLGVMKGLNPDAVSTKLVCDQLAEVSLYARGHDLGAKGKHKVNFDYRGLGGLAKYHIDQQNKARQLQNAGRICTASNTAAFGPVRSAGQLRSGAILFSTKWKQDPPPKWNRPPPETYRKYYNKGGKQMVHEDKLALREWKKRKRKGKEDPGEKPTARYWTYDYRGKDIIRARQEGGQKLVEYLRMSHAAVVVQLKGDKVYIIDAAGGRGATALVERSASNYIDNKKYFVGFVPTLNKRAVDLRRHLAAARDYARTPGPSSGGRGKPNRCVPPK